jgi:hypothetical protein
VVRTLGDLQRSELRKLADEDTEQIDRLHLMLDSTIEHFKVAWNALVNTKSTATHLMTDDAKAAHKISGDDQARKVEELRAQRFEIEKLIAIEHQNDARISKGAGYHEALADFQVLTKHAEAVSSGFVKVTPDVRRRLGHALGTAQLRLAESV